MAQIKTSIGGQALIEGVMMKGPYKTAMAVRVPDGSIHIEEVNTSSSLGKKKFFKLPFIRGVYNLINSMRIGMKCITRSAELALPEDESSKTADGEKKTSKLFGVLMALASVLGVVLALFLFMYIPAFLFDLINKHVISADISGWRAVFEGILKLIVFLVYLKVVTLMKDIHRVFEYHGAEHKTIFCYEAGEELTPENVRKYKRFHPRCGTSFMFLMIIVGIVLTFILTCFINVAAIPRVLWVAIKILILPVLCGVGYEILKFTARHDNTFTKIIATPGLWVQRLTTYEPDDSEIECAIAALKEVIPDDESDRL